MHVAERVPVTSKEACDILNWIGPRCVLHQGSFGSEPEVTSSGSPRPAGLVRTKVRWLHSHQRKRTEPWDQNLFSAH